jgi:hypothetical protein
MTTAIKFQELKVDAKEQPQNCTDEELVRWANQQRRAYFAGRLSADQIAKLESLNIWVWENDYVKESMEWNAKESEQEDAREDNNGRVPLTTYKEVDGEMNMKQAKVVNEVEDYTTEQCIYSQKIVDLINKWTPKLPWIETARVTEDNRIAWFNGGYLSDYGWAYQFGFLGKGVYSDEPGKDVPKEIMRAMVIKKCIRATQYVGIDCNDDNREFFGELFDVCQNLPDGMYLESYDNQEGELCS